MVQRRHEEDAFLRLFIVEHLDHDREGLGHEQAADDDDDELHLGDHGQTAQRHAERERAGIPHEDVGREGVEPQKPDAGTGERPGKQRRFQGAVAEGDGSHHEHDHHDRAGSQPVQTVGEVHRVAQAHEQDEAVDEIEPGNLDAIAHGHHRGEHAQVDHAHEGDLHRGRHIEQVHRSQDEYARDEKLPDELRLGGEPQRALVGHLRGVVDKAQKSRSQRGAQEQPQFRSGGVHRGHQREDDNGHEHDDTAHSGGALLHQVALGAVGAHLLADLSALEETYPGRHEHHGDDHGQHHRQKDHERGIGREQRQH